MFTKYNKWFEETAADPARRRAAIADFSKRRTILFCCALMSTICTLAMFFTSTNSLIQALMCLSAFLSWFVVLSLGSDLRALKLVDRFFSRREKPAA
jgi:hypothetical protein